MSHRIALLPALALAALPATLAAQGLPDIQDAINRGTSIDEALREQARTSEGPTDGDTGEIDGEAGVYVLTVNEIFYVGASAGTGWEENPLRTVDDTGDSIFANGALTAGIQTVFGGSFDAGLSATVSGIDYEKSFAPSSRTITGAANFGRRIGGTPLYVGISAFGGFSYDESFENPTSFYGGSAALSAGFPLGQRGLLRTSVNGGRQMGEIAENNSWNASTSADISYLVTPELTVGASARLTRVWYDNFFEDVTFVERKDWQYGGGVNANYSLNDWLSVSANFGYEERDSAFFLSNYNGLSASLAITGRKRF